VINVTEMIVRGVPGEALHLLRHFGGDVLQEVWITWVPAGMSNQGDKND
jgi:hypothetical protein